MTTEGEPQPPQADAAHLDDDVEALEDPVHCGDALHQHELHQHELHEHELNEQELHEQQRHPAG